MMKRFNRHERAVERKLDRIVELLEIQVKIMTALAVTEMLEDEE
jgi:hypothetical protein|tara:strand:+ start:738 stop:869 length:132 start_codon:yes stop_codon:yes gene_type:complete